MASRSFSRSSKSQPKQHNRQFQKKRSNSPRKYNSRRENIPRSHKLFVTNIDSKFTNQELKAQLGVLFGEHGKVVQILIKTKPGSSNSFAFIQFEDLESASNALENLKGKPFKGKQLKVQFGKGQKKPQQRQICYICQRSGHFAKQCRDRDRVDRYHDRHDKSRSYHDQRRRSRSNHRHKKRYSRSRSISSSSSDRHHSRRSRSYERHHHHRRSPDRRNNGQYRKNY